jgi:hypothetical protein
MAYAPTTSVFPSERRSLGVAVEAVAGTGVLPANTVPVADFNPEDKVTGLLDESLRSAMAGVYGYTQGPYVADLAIPSSIVYGDMIGFLLYNILGDLTETGTEVGTDTTTINHGGGYPAGTTGVITVTSGTAFSAGAPGFVQIDTGTSAEVVAYSAAASTTITLSGTTRFAHATTVAVTEVTAPYTHVFSLLNGTGNAQPPTLTLTDYNFINSVVQSRWYPFTRFSEITFTGNAEQLFKYAAKGMGYANSVPGSAPAVNVSAVPAEPAWNSNVGIGGTASASPNYSVAEWEITLTRVTEAYFTASGQQNPYTIGAGKFTAASKWNFSPAISEQPLTELLSNTQPQTQIIQTNGLAGAAKVSVQFDMAVTAFDTAVLQSSKALLGYNDSADLIGNATNTGQSAGYSPLQVTLVNGFATYA